MSGDESDGGSDIVRFGRQINRRPNIMPDKFAWTGSDFNEFKIQFETAARLNGWDEKDKLSFLTVSLTGAARTYYAYLEENRKESYEQAMEALQG
jgi:hypothetical protein